MLRGIDLTVESGEVHAVMGPNGAGKSTLSHVLMGKPGYEVTGGSVTLDGVDLLALPTWQALELACSSVCNTTEVPGVSLRDLLANSSPPPTVMLPASTPAFERKPIASGFDHKFSPRPLNVDLSGARRSATRPSN
ncbi:MAG: ATP-binding cassette domain-containing protein [Acidimicrobiales bacterium]